MAEIYQRRFQPIVQDSDSTGFDNFNYNQNIQDVHQGYQNPFQSWQGMDNFSNGIYGNQQQQIYENRIHGNPNNWNPNNNNDVDDDYLRKWIDSNPDKVAEVLSNKNNPMLAPLGGEDPNGYQRSGDYGDRNNYMQSDGHTPYGPLNRLFRWGMSGLTKQSEDKFYEKEEANWNKEQDRIHAQNLLNQNKSNENQSTDNQNQTPLISKRKNDSKSFDPIVNDNKTSQINKNQNLGVVDDKGFYNGKLNQNQQDDAWFKHHSGMTLSADEQAYVDYVNTDNKQYGADSNIQGTSNQNQPITNDANNNQTPNISNLKDKPSKKFAPIDKKPPPFNPKKFDPANPDNSEDDIKSMQTQIGADPDGKWGPKSQTAYDQWVDDNKTWFDKSRDERKEDGDWYAGKQLDKFKENKESGEGWYPGKMLTNAWENSRLGGGPGHINPNRYLPTGEKMSKSDVQNLNKNYSNTYNSSFNMNHDRPGGLMDGRRFQQMHNDPDYLAHVKSYWPEEYSKYEAAVADKDSPMYDRIEHNETMRNLSQKTGQKVEYDYYSGDYHTIDSEGNKTLINLSDLETSQSDTGFEPTMNNQTDNQVSGQPNAIINAMENKSIEMSKNQPFQWDSNIGNGSDLASGFPVDLKASRGQVYMFGGKQFRYKGPDQAMMQGMVPMGREYKKIMTGVSKNWEKIDE